ncbi:hypothetical protein Tco_1574724 [Tanacetum coccineum]
MVTTTNGGSGGEDGGSDEVMEVVVVMIVEAGGVVEIMVWRGVGCEDGGGVVVRWWRDDDGSGYGRSLARIWLEVGGKAPEKGREEGEDVCVARVSKTEGNPNRVMLIYMKV